MHMITINKCDSLSDNQPGLHLPVFQKIASYHFENLIWEDQPNLGTGLVYLTEQYLVIYIYSLLYI